MDQLNAEFINSPPKFLKKYTADNVRDARADPTGAANNVLNANKYGTFDFRKDTDTNVFFKSVSNPAEIKEDVPINAYFCPFLQGHNAVGFVDIPMANPQYHFVITPSMQGCALHVTTVNPGFYRVWHNQHPGSPTDALIIGAPVSVLSYADYGGAYDPLVCKCGFNCLYYVAGVWHYVGQPNILLPSEVTYEFSFWGEKIVSGSRQPVARNTAMQIIFRSAQ